MCNPSLADIIPSPPPPSSSSSSSSSSSHSKNYNFGSRFGKPSLRSMAQVKEQSSLFFSDSYDVEEPRYFLDSCYRCRTRLHLGDDIYMYRGDTPFCSEECRQEQIEIDELAEEKKMNELIMRKKNSIKSKPKSGSHKLEIHVTHEVAC